MVSPLNSNEGKTQPAYLPESYTIAIRGKSLNAHLTDRTDASTLCLVIDAIFATEHLSPLPNKYRND
jgi:hypothetical protein